jgi:WD40 repeat protein
MANNIPANTVIVAIENYDQHPRRGEVATTAFALAHALDERGIPNVHPTLLKGGTSQELKRQILSWLHEAGGNDRLLLYWSSHGKREADGFYLITQDSPSYDLNTDNAVDPRSLAKGAANSKAKKILIIFDACFSGEAIGEMTRTISDVLSGQAPSTGSRRGVAVLASAHAQQNAVGGFFSNVLKDLLTDARTVRRWSDEDQFIDYDTLVASLADEIERRGMVQDFVPSAIGSTIELLPNPLYRPGLVAEVVEERAWRLSRSGSGEHFDLAARGIEVGTSGWYFAGRRNLLRKLIVWLGSAQHGIRIVTGPPGSGKSAVLGRLATLSDPEYRKVATQAGILHFASDDTVPPEGIIDVAIHAKGKTLDDCARAVAHALALPTGKEVAVDVEALVAAVGRLERRVTIMIDALDEATSGHGRFIAARLIIPLARLARVRVVVGSRRSIDGAVLGEERHGRLHAVFGADLHIDDLEDEPETKEDIAEYVLLRLAASTKHSSNSVGIAAAARRVAERADGVFLYARIVSRTLQELDHLESALPATALEAFVHDLQARFGGEQQRVDDLLAALAWGEGKGLTRRVWPKVANAFSSRSYGDDDVQWVLDHAGWHIIETGEDGQAVYRLGHQALADHYRGRRESREAQNQIVEALADKTAGASWFDADRYLWRHIAAHADQAGRLAFLIRDPGYLAVADPARLLVLLPNIRDEEGRRFADIYNRVVDRLIEQPPSDRFALIHLTAQMEAPDLAQSLEPIVATGWRCRWARVSPSAPHRIIGRHSLAATAVAFAKIDGRSVAVSGSIDGAVRLWDARTGEQIGRALEERQRIAAVAVGRVDGSVVVVSGSINGTIRLWNPFTGKRIGSPLMGNQSSFNPGALGVVDGEAVGVSGSADGGIRLWNARTGNTIRKSSRNRAKVTAVAFGVVNGRALVVSASNDKAIRLWSANTGEPIGKPLKGYAGAVTALALGVVDGRAVVICGSWDGTIRLLDIRTGEPIGQPLEGHQSNLVAIAFGEVNGRAVAVSGSWDATVRLWYAQTTEPISLRLAGHAGQVTAVTLGAVDHRAVVVSGSWDGTIRRWDAATGHPIGEPIKGHMNGVSAIDIGLIDGHSVIVSGSPDRTLRLWDARTGRLFGNPFETSKGGVTAVALGEVDGRASVVSGSWDGTIDFWNARTGKRIGRPPMGHRTIVNEVGQSRESKVTAVALGEVNGRAVLVSGSDDETIQLWDARSGKRIGQAFEGHSGAVTAVAMGKVDGREVVASGSDDETIWVWDARTGKRIGKPLTGHTNAVTAIALCSVNGRTVAVSGSDDATIRIWDLCAGHEQFAIQLGIAVTSIAYDLKIGVAAGTSRGLVYIDLPEVEGE